MATTIDRTKLAAMLEKLRAEKIEKANQNQQNQPQEPTTVTLSNPTIQAQAQAQAQSNLIEDKNGKLISYNTKQKEFVDLASSGQSCVLIPPPRYSLPSQNRTLPTHLSN